MELVRVAIAGAGVGGLAVAGGLLRAGADVRVFERSEAAMTSGFALSLFENGLRALDRLGLGAATRALSPAAAPRVTSGIRNHKGRWISRFGPDVTRSTHLVAREALSAVLRAPVEDRVEYGRQVVAVETGQVTLADGHSEGGFDLVVVADGARSLLRTRWPHDPGLRYVGVHAWRGLTRGPVEVGGLGEIWGHGRLFGLAPLPDGRMYWFATLRVSEDSPPEASVAAVREAFGRYDLPDIGSVLATTDDDRVACHPITEMRSPCPSLVQGRAVLVGDAAHAMTPNLGQGANQALEDAALLVHQLSPVARSVRPSQEEVGFRLQEWDVARRSRVWVVASRSSRIGRVTQISTPLGCTIRNTVIGWVPDRLLDEAAVKLQAWDVVDG